MHPSSTLAMLKIVSSTPEAPRVCPYHPFKAVKGTSESPAACMAFDSIWSLNMVAVP